jgi:isoquinoline 1-oxidoreductase beta subunit
MSTTPGAKMDSGAPIDRRALIAGSAAAAGALVLGFHVPFEAVAQPPDQAPEINAWVIVQPDDTVVIRVARSEMGQGVFTALPMLVAEELECEWSKVKAAYVSPNENLRRKHVWGNMATGTSTSVSSSQESLRRAGATAREMLIAAAAARWNCPASECRAANSTVAHLPSGRSVRFGELAGAAARVPPPAHVALKDPKDWTLIGTPRRRLDVRDKVVGEPVFAIDVRLPGMLYAAIVQPPVFKATLKSLDAAKAAGMNGVRRIVSRGDFVAVVADGWWQAKQAAEALSTTWNEGANGNVSSATINELLCDGLNAEHAALVCSAGDVEAGLLDAVTRISADYAVPFLAHATMEPQNCTARVTADLVEIWAPTQDGDTALSTAAAAAGVAPGKVVVHKTMLGGGFGRRGPFQDFVRQAVLIAKEVGQPVKLVWSREQDMTHDFYRPTGMARLTAGLDAHGMPIAWKVRIAGQSILGSVAPELLSAGFDADLAQGFKDLPYAIASYLVDGTVRNAHVPIGPWRGADYSQNVFFRECFVDEMAHASGQDPYLFRRRLLGENAPLLRVLDAAAAKAGWSGPTREGVARGIALNNVGRSVSAQVVEASMGADGIHVHRIVCAVDVGHVVNPLTVQMQTEGAIVYGLAAALFGEISVNNGRVEQTNFNNYKMLRMAHMPRVETVIVRGGDFWGGVGELAVPPVAPALCNAIFAATGKRVRSLPLKSQNLI